MFTCQPKRGGIGPNRSFEDPGERVGPEESPVGDVDHAVLVDQSCELRSRS